MHVIDDAAEEFSMLAATPKHVVQEAGISEEAEHVVDPCERLVGQMLAHQLLEHCRTLAERLSQKIPIEREVHFVETDDGHGHRVEALLEALSQQQFLLAELVVAIQDANLDDDLDDVLHDLVGQLLVSGLVSGQSV